jgi:hypothetical protein
MKNSRGPQKFASWGVKWQWRMANAMRMVMRMVIANAGDGGGDKVGNGEARRMVKMISASRIDMTERMSSSSYLLYD